MPAITIRPGIISQMQQEYTPDARGGTVKYTDVNGDHVFQISDPNGANPPGQDVEYKFVPIDPETGLPAKDPDTIQFTPLHAPRKVYSLNEIYPLNASTILLAIQCNDAASGQPSQVNGHYAEVSGLSVTPSVRNGGGNGSGVSLADVQAWLVRQMGLTG